MIAHCNCPKCGAADSNIFYGGQVDEYYEDSLSSLVVLFEGKCKACNATLIIAETFSLKNIEVMPYEEEDETGD